MSYNFDHNQLFIGPVVKQYGSHMVTTNVIKGKKTKYITLDSRFRDEYNNGKLINYYFTLPEKITNAKSMSVFNIEMPMSIYNFSTDLGNNFFSLFVNDSVTPYTFVISIPSGFYTLEPYSSSYNPSTAVTGNNLLILALNTAISNAFKNKGGRYINYDPLVSNNAQIVYFAPGPGNTIQLINKSAVPIIVNFAINSDGSASKYNLKAQLGWALGFHNTSYSVASNITITGDSCANLNTPRYIYLVLDEFSAQKQNSFTAPLSNSLVNQNIIAKIPVNYNNSSFGTVLTGNKYNGVILSDNRTYSGTTDIQRMNVQLLNEFGMLINLNGLDFSFTLEVDYE